ncbi:MAG: polyhydroxyalkanoic acid system family protein [Candidatus Aminicenantes bacterium]|nr:polyhydroxyalkanoic acid system family protein [Candidatus Aminicenantes bacterium]
MANIELTHNTSLSAEEIKQKAEGLIRDALKEYKDKISDVRQEWRDDTLFFSFKVMGFSVSGETIVQDHFLTIKAKLPFAAMFFRGKIEEKIRDKARELFP